MAKIRFSRALGSALLCAQLLANSVSPAAAQESEGDGSNDAEDAPLIGYVTSAAPLEDDEWVDPVIRFDLDPSALAPLPDFDVSEFHDSTVFAAGVDRVPIERDDGDGELELYVDRHRQLLQAVETLDGELEANAQEISARRPRVGQLSASIDHEHAEEARLAYEIDIRVDAITEYAVRTFINEGELEAALDIPATSPSEIRVVSDQVREDQLRQIDVRELEIARREARRADLEDDLRLLRSELRLLREDRSDLLAHRRDAAALLPHNAASYQRALHSRLPHYVVDTDIPLVVLNAYVVAERRLAQDSESCGIEWWMLAGIGKVESFHGYFADSTVNINGRTTELIRGPALDGRILAGAEFLTDGLVAPDATNRTESQSIATPEAAPSTAPESEAVAEPAAETAPAEDANAEPSDPANPADGSEPSPKPVIKRLALILDTDGGELDGDTTYDRAVGPMQFIPQTWRTWQADGNGDGETDPHNIYDAALASAHYLCAATGSMATPGGRQLGYFAYNHDEEYSALVESYALSYRDQISIPDDEFGTTLPLGIGDPARETADDDLAIDMLAIEDAGLLDW